MVCFDFVKENVGIFSLFGKKDRSPSVASPKATAAAKARDALTRPSEPQADIAREQQVQEQRAAAKATALKIDAIESEMSSEFVRPASTSRNAVAADGTDPTDAGVRTELAQNSSNAEPAANATTAETATLFDEVAILFANGEQELVEQMLQDGIDADGLSAEVITAWAMLFDLYQSSGDTLRFESLSIAYAKRFESSPPAWTAAATRRPAAIEILRAPHVPTVVFSAALDAAIGASLAQTRLLAQSQPVVRLDFAGVGMIDAVGCAMLLSTLREVQKAGTDLILAGAAALCDRIRATLMVGRRDDSEAAWLLLLELLALRNEERAFEEASIDYCITFEVSPPAFVAPNNKVTTAMVSPDVAAPQPDTFVMPAEVSGRTEALLNSLSTFAADHNPLRIDCSALTRIDVNAAGQLLVGLTPLAGDGRMIEFFQVSHLVAALLQVVGLPQIARITTRRL